MTSIKVKFRPSRIAQQEGTLYYQVIHKRKVRILRTAYRLFPSEWSSAQERIRVAAARGEARQRYLSVLQERLDADLLRLRHGLLQLQQESSDFDVDHLLHRYASVPSCSPTFLSYTSHLLDQLAQSGRHRTVSTYRSALRSFVRFLQPREDLALQELDAHLVVRYESWLKARGVCPNTSSYYLRNLRAIFNRAVEQGWVTTVQSPFKHGYTGIGKTQKRAIALERIRQIRDLELQSKSLAFARDIFLFSFYTRGMSFVDMAFLRKTDLHHGILRYRRRKTGQQLLVKWEKPMQELVDRYATSGSPYMLPLIRKDSSDEWRQYQNAVHRINRNLKIIGEQIGLPIPLTTYVARHTWASIAQSQQVGLSVISEALGHDSEKTTQIYLASLDTRAVDQANSLVLEALDQ